MTTFLIIALLISLAVAVGTALLRWVAEDGGPRHASLPRAEDRWSLELPTRPYALR
ncbi:MAG: hypothetical protein ICV70_06595 [Jiangellaceae bacterium]|nr:hypothetical protein [Jiangellaceae bacterium]